MTQQLLDTCGVSEAIIESMQALAFFTQTVVLARHASTPRSVVLDPQGYSEDCLQVVYRLVRYPRALRQEITELENEGGEQLGTPSTDGRGEAMFLGHNTPQSIKPDPDGPKHTGTPLNSLIRVAALLYIEDLLPDTRSTDLYTILLTVLIHQVRTLSLRIRHRRLDPSSLATPDDNLRDDDSIRPVLLWACMVGHAVATFTNNDRGTHLDKTPFEDCAAMLLTGTSDVSGSDLELCEMLPLRELRSVSCEEGTLLGQLVAGHETRQVWH